LKTNSMEIYSKGRFKILAIWSVKSMALDFL
jgi:hypothetical protein